MDVNPLYILQLINISKSFPGVKALDGVSLNIEKGKVHALMGENGAGKSTLMKILIGLYQPDTGEIYHKGNKVSFLNVNDAIKEGFSMIHQELFPFPNLTVAENIFMGNEPTKTFPGWIDTKKMNKEAAMLLSALGVNIQAGMQMKDCSIAEMQMVEIAKAISNKAEIIIMDEPTSAISGREVNILFDIIEGLKKKGIAIIYISHKMEEIHRISDTITVMRDGRNVATHAAADITNEQLIALIVGRSISAVFEKRQPKPGEILFSVSELSGKRFKNINFHVRAGEILGIAGLMGAGRTEIVNAIFGLEKVYSGEMFARGKKVTIRSPREAIESGIALVSEDRKRYGLVLTSSVKDNITLAALRKCCNGQFLNIKKENDLAGEQITKLRIKTQSKDQEVKFLSGGNQQKVVLAKMLLNDPEIVILDEPTRGIDIGAKSEIYKLVCQLADEGKAIILISSELLEILGMSDRILVIHEGTIETELTGAEASQELIMKHAMPQ